MEKFFGGFYKYAVTAFLLIGGLVFTITGVVKVYQICKYPSTTAVITKIEFEEGVGDEAYSYDVTVKYAVDGTSYEGMIDTGKSSMKVGDSVKIRYNPENPTTITSAGVGVVAISLGLGVLLLVFGIVAAKETLKRKKVRRNVGDYVE